MTANEPYDDILFELEKLQIKGPNIKMNSIISDTVHFLDITISNTHGRLKTYIYHKPSVDPYYLPYTALIRAARLSTNLKDFNFERLRIEISLLLNNYPPSFITDQFLRCFQVHKADTQITRFDETVYHKLHKALLYQPSKRELHSNQTKPDRVQFPPALQKTQWNPSVMYLKHNFKSGPISKFTERFRAWWRKYYRYSGSAANRLKIRLIPTTNRTLQNFRVHKKPPRRILTKI